jgi:ABC-2 type transport system permease protein
MLTRAYVLEAKYELLKLARMPAYALPTLAAPLMFYLFFGIAFGSQGGGGLARATYMLATYGAFGVIGASLFAFGVGVAVERGQGWLLLKRASPMPPLAYFVAKIAASALFALLIVLGLFFLAAAFGGVRLPVGTWLALAGVLVLGVPPFCAIGLAIGSIARPNSAPAIVNMLYLPMAFLSGLWVPLAFLPPAIREFAPMLPAYHLGALALGVIGAGGGVWWVHALVLAAFTTAGLALAALGFRRDEGRLYG